MRTKCLRLDNSLPSEPEPLGGWIHPEPSKGGNGVRAIAVVTVGALVLVVAAVLGPAAIAGDKPKTGDERAATSRARSRRRQLHRELPLLAPGAGRPDRLPRQAGCVASAHVRREPHDERVLQLRLAALGRNDVHACRRHGRVLGADALPGHDGDLPAGRDHLLPPRDARRGEPVPEQPARDRGRRDRDEPAGRCA